jgi:phosphoglycolate phosphatase-like HAD superfamily hydrolase
MAVHPRARARLVLWDIDHTLIETRGFGTQLYHAAFKAVTGRTVEHDVPITGQTELAIVSQALLAHGIEPTDDLVERYRIELARQYEANAAELSHHGRALPGARNAIAELAQVKGVVQGLLTGNLREVAHTKVSAFGLDQHIDWDASAFGDDNPVRAQLVEIARRLANIKYDNSFTSSNTVIIGDSDNDVRSAHEGGALAIAVASGGSTEAELRSAGAETVLADLTDAGKLVDAVLLHCRSPQ